MKSGKSVPGGILIIIGAVFTFISVTFMAFCMSIGNGFGWWIHENATSSEVRTTLVTVFGVVTFILAIFGAVYSFKYNTVAGILSAAASGLLLILGLIIGYWNAILILAIICLAAGAIISFLVKSPVTAKPEPPQGNYQPPQNGWQQPPQQNNWQPPQPPQGNYQPPQNGWQQPPQQPPQNGWQQPPQQNDNNNPPPPPPQSN